MTTLAQVLALTASLLGGRSDVETVKRLAPVFIQEAAAANLPASLVVAVSFRESSLRTSARGSSGELGLMQIKPGGQERYHCAGLNWRSDVRHNIRCGVRLLAHAKATCGGPPENWLRQYKGLRGCGPSVYGRKVVELLRREKGKR